MTQEAKVLIGIGVVTIAILLGAAFLLGDNKGNSADNQTQVAKVADASLLVRPDSHKIEAASKSASVTMVEFADFQCPGCGNFYPLSKRLQADYRGKVTFVFRHYPLVQLHKNAMTAALAAEAAGKQGKFWEMHDKLFEDQKDWQASDKPLNIFVGYAKDLGLDVDAFRESVESKEFTDKIQKDVNDGNATGVTSTPTVFINGYKQLQVFDEQSLRQALDESLKKK